MQLVKKAFLTSGDAQRLRALRICHSHFPGPGRTKRAAPGIRPPASKRSVGKTYRKMLILQNYKVGHQALPKEIIDAIRFLCVTGAHRCPPPPGSRVDPCPAGIFLIPSPPLLPTKKNLFSPQALNFAGKMDMMKHSADTRRYPQR